MTLLLEMFTYPFIVRAFAAGVLLSLCAALLGVPLVLKRYSMIGDGLSHVSFGALSVALACGWAPLPVSIPVVIVAALGLLRMTERSRMGEIPELHKVGLIVGNKFSERFHFRSLKAVQRAHGQIQIHELGL